MAKLIRYKGYNFRKARAGNGDEILQRIETFLHDETEEPVRMMCGFWRDQQQALTYQEIRQAVIDGAFTEETFREWSQDYSLFIANKLRTMWEQALLAGAGSQPLIYHIADFHFESSAPNVLAWIQNRGAELVTASVEQQRDAIRVLLEKSVRERHSVDELAKMIRPCVGLTEPQAKANLKYYENIVKTLREEHPRMKTESIQRKAREAAAKYAEKQHRYRAMNIAQTEMAYAYNKGADESVRQAQEKQLIGKVVKRWCTSNDDQVCEQCRSLEGTEIAMDDQWTFKGVKSGENLTPPAHPRCACAVEYIEVNSADY